MAIFATDMDKVIEFDTKPLGFVLGNQFSPGNFIKTGNVYVGFHATNEMISKDNGTQTTQVSFQVQNIKKIQSILKELGVDFTRDMTELLSDFG